MSLIGQLVDAATCVVSVAGGGFAGHARIQRLTAGELMEGGASGLVVPDVPEGAKRAVKARSTGGEAMVDGMRFYERVVFAGVLAIGATAATLEPCTIVASDDQRERRGTARLPVRALPTELVVALAGEIIEVTNGAGWRTRVSCFLGGGPADIGTDGQEVAGAANGAP